MASSVVGEQGVFWAVSDDERYQQSKPGNLEIQLQAITSQLTSIHADVILGRISKEQECVLAQKLQEITQIAHATFVCMASVPGEEGCIFTPEQQIVKLLNEKKYTELTLEEMEVVDAQLRKISPELTPMEVWLKAESFKAMLYQLRGFRENLVDFEDGSEKFTIEAMEQAMKTLKAEIPAKLLKLENLLLRFKDCVHTTGGVWDLSLNIEGCKKALDAEWAEIQRHWHRLFGKRNDGIVFTAEIVGRVCDDTVDDF